MARMSTFAVLFIQLLVFAAEASSSCRARISAGRDPDERDTVRMECLQRELPRLDWTTCLRRARGFEYLGGSQLAVGLCLFERKSKPRVGECLAAAASVETGDVRDDLLWGCLERLKLTISQKDCHRLARQMTYPSLKNRASSYCQSEIRDSLK